MHLSTVPGSQRSVPARARTSGGREEFQPEKRVALLELLSQGMRLMEAAEEIEVSPKQIWGRARSDPAWGAELQATIDRARPTDVRHGRQSAYRQGCRCSECRAAR